MKLHRFQIDAVRRTLALLRDGRAVLLVAPTGAGKTVMAGAIARRYRRVLYVSHRIEHINQAKATMGRHVQAMTIQAAISYGPRRVDLLIVDEAHRSAANTYRALIEKYSKTCRLGLTATPLRTDGQGLKDAFDEMVEAAKVCELVPQYLVPYRAFEAPAVALEELQRLKKHCGDYRVGDLNQLINTPRLVGDVVREYLKHGLGRKAIVFAVGVSHSQNIASELVKAGVRAEHLDGKTPPSKRAATLARLSAGDIDVLCNVNLFTEGWDCPAVSCVVMARPTESMTLYLQAVGRGMRVFPGKSDLLILDHAGNIQRHGAPDKDRDWRLESREEQKRRLAEIAELERLFSLGYESLTDYELEQARIRAERYSAKQVYDLIRHEIGVVGAHSFLSSRGVSPVSTNGPLSSYLKSEVDHAINEFRLSVSTQEAVTITGITRTSLKKSLENFQIYPIQRKGTQGSDCRYLRSEIEDFARTCKAACDFDECAKILNVSRPYAAMILSKSGINKLPIGRGMYQKAAVIELAKQRKNKACPQCGSLTDRGPNGVRRFCSAECLNKFQNTLRRERWHARKKSKV